MKYDYVPIFENNQTMNLECLRLPSPCRCTAVTGNLFPSSLCEEITNLLIPDSFISSAEVYENGDMNLFVRVKGEKVSCGVIRARHAS